MNTTKQSKTAVPMTPEAREGKLALLATWKQQGMHLRGAKVYVAKLEAKLATDAALNATTFSFYSEHVATPEPEINDNEQASDASAEASDEMTDAQWLEYLESEAV